MSKTVKYQHTHTHTHTVPRMNLHTLKRLEDECLICSFHAGVGATFEAPSKSLNTLLWQLIDGVRWLLFFFITTEEWTAGEGCWIQLNEKQLRCCIKTWELSLKSEGSLITSWLLWSGRGLFQSQKASWVHLQITIQTLNFPQCVDTPLCKGSYVRQTWNGYR